MTETKKVSKLPKQVTEPKVETETTKKDEKEIKAIERVIENKAIAPQDVFGKLTRSQIDLIKRTIAKGANDDELRLFIQVCKGAQLNPFMKQVFLVPRWDNKEGKEVRAIQVSIDGFRAIAEESKVYAGNDDPVFDGEQEIVIDKKKIIAPTKATVTVHKMIDGQKCAFTATARWTEYYPGDKIGFMWRTKPYLMLGKCAEALALRKAFPKLLSGMYAQEEMDQVPEKIDTQSKAFVTLLTIIKSATMKEIDNYKEKMMKSDKYTKEQKAEFIATVEARVKELTPAQEPVKVDDTKKIS